MAQEDEVKGKMKELTNASLELIQALRKYSTAKDDYLDYNVIHDVEWDKECRKQSYLNSKLKKRIDQLMRDLL